MWRSPYVAVRVGSARVPGPGPPNGIPDDASDCSSDVSSINSDAPTITLESITTSKVWSKRLRDGLERFIRFLGRDEYELICWTFVDQRPAIAALLEFGEFLFDGGKGKRKLYHFGDAMSAVQRLRPEWCFKTVAKRIAAWQKHKGVRHRPPIPSFAVRALISQSADLGRLDLVVALLVGFTAALRPTEIRNLCVQDFFMDHDNYVLYIVLRKTKAGTQQHVRVMCKVSIDIVCKCLARLGARSAVKGRILLLSDYKFRKVVNDMFTSFRVPVGTFTLGGFRSGGACDSYRRGAPLADLRWLLRHKQLSTVESYIMQVGALAAPMAPKCVDTLKAGSSIMGYSLELLFRRYPLRSVGARRELKGLSDFLDDGGYWIKT